MRRKDRQVTDIEKIKECLDDSECLHTGFYDSMNGQVYVLPVNFGYELEGEKLTLYFHGAKEGRKADLAAEGPVVGFEMETHLKTVAAENACSYYEEYLSIIGNGKIQIINDAEEKKHGLQAIMFKASGRNDWEFPGEALNATAVFRIDVTDYTCKAH